MLSFFYFTAFLLQDMFHFCSVVVVAGKTINNLDTLLLLLG